MAHFSAFELLCRAIRKTPDGAWLAPVYDFAPMRLDPEGGAADHALAPARARRRGLDWRAPVTTLERYAEPAVLLDGLRALAARLADLAEHLEALGLEREVLEHPGLGLRDTASRLRAWGLL